MRIDGCSALVAGGASGLGAATAIALLDAGARVTVLDLPEAVASATLPGSVALVAGDVLDSEAVARAIEAAGSCGSRSSAPASRLPGASSAATARSRSRRSSGYCG